MNLVSLINRFLTADMTGRIASALGLDHTAKRLMLIACSAICLGLAFPTSSFAQRKALATCEMEWSANKAFNQAVGITERDWVAKCRADIAKKSADARWAEIARQRSCTADWKAAKATGTVTAGMTWPTFWSECDQRKKAMAPATGGYPPVARGAGGMQVAPAPHLRVSTIPPHPTTRHQRRLYAETNGTHKGRKLTPGN